jgi:hypothetical protein
VVVLFTVPVASAVVWSMTDLRDILEADLSVRGLNDAGAIVGGTAIGGGAGGKTDSAAALDCQPFIVRNG